MKPSNVNPMNEDYYHEQNSCYDHNSFGFDQFQPPQYTVNHPIFNSQNELLNSQNKLMEQMATLRELVDQAIQKKEEEKRIAEEQAAKDRSWKIPFIMTLFRKTESDEVIKSSVENLIPIPSESEGIPDKMCDVPLGNNPTPLNALNEHYEIVVNSDDDNSSDLEVVEIVDPEVGRIDDDILLTIKDDILREKLLNVNLLIAKIDALSG
ncbi:hypothetical protein Tco_1353481 [Tanacetum coccineum]